MYNFINRVIQCISCWWTRRQIRKAQKDLEINFKYLYELPNSEQDQLDRELIRYQERCDDVRRNRERSALQVEHDNEVLVQRIKSLQYELVGGAIPANRQLERVFPDRRDPRRITGTTFKRAIEQNHAIQEVMQ